MEVTNIAELAIAIDTMWVLFAAALVFLMQAGFLALEIGAVRPVSATAVAMKNLIDWLTVCLVFFALGFGVMFGYSDNPLFGASLFLLDSMNAEGALPLGMAFFMFQLAFAATAATIVSGAMSERTCLTSYLCAAVGIGLFIYPVFGFWAWGDTFFSTNKPWLAGLGFMDFAGATVVHSTGGWVALIGCWMIGPRMGRYKPDGSLNSMPANGVYLSILGVLLLWLGWWGFNGGSTFAFNDEVGYVILNTNISGAAAGIAAFLHCLFVQKRLAIYEKSFCSTLGGLVAITACCNVVSHVDALVIGACAGVINNVAYDFLKTRLRIDDPVAAIPVHLVCGIWGTLCVALFGEQELLNLPRWQQFGVQLVGITSCMLWTCSTAYIMFKLLKMTIGLRVSPQEEQAGIQINPYLRSKADKVKQETIEQMEKLSEEELHKIMSGK